MAVISGEDYKILKTQAEKGMTRKVKCDFCLEVHSEIGPCGGKRKKEADPEPESALMGKIMKFCKLEGYPAQCFRSSRKAVGFLVPGWPD